MRPNGLNINKINNKFGGRQPIMQDLTLSKNEFGPYHNHTYALQEGDVQLMQFSVNDVGPCYMKEEERERNRYDIDTGRTREKEMLKVDLLKALKADGMDNPCGNKDKLQQLCQKRNLPI